MLTAGVAAWRAWQAAGGAMPDVVAGHSLGEYAALVAAGSLAFRDAVPLVRFRAQAMQEAVPQGVGAMAAILGGDDAAIAEACAGSRRRARWSSRRTSTRPARSSSRATAQPSSARSGPRRLAARSAGCCCRCRRRSTARCLKPAAERLADAARAGGVPRPSIPVIHNVDVAEHRTPDAIRAALAKQAASPVRWTETVRAIAARGVTDVIEAGPGRVLAALARKIEPSLKVHALTDGHTLGDAKAALAT